MYWTSTTSNLLSTFLKRKRGQITGTLKKEFIWGFDRIQLCMILQESLIDFHYKQQKYSRV